MSVKLTVPRAVPDAVGLNSTETVQVAPAVSDVPHVFAEMTNGPVMATLLSVKVTLP